MMWGEAKPPCRCPIAPRGRDGTAVLVRNLTPATIVRTVNFKHLMVSTSWARWSICRNNDH